jgi:hypothetical protein
MSAMRPQENPFASRFVRPGAVRFSFLACDQSCRSGTRQSSGLALHADFDQLIDRLASCGWRGAIVGPHGSGKSTLLAGLSIELARRGVPVRLLAGSAGNKTRLVERTRSGDTQRTIYFVDGFDMLPRWRRWRLHWQCRRNGCGLVVTGHSQVGRASNPSGIRPFFMQSRMDGRVGNPSYRGLPVLLYTQTTPDLAERIARELAGEPFASAARGYIRDSFARHDGNLREVLFDLYDLYERQVRRVRIEGCAPPAQSLSSNQDPSFESAIAAFAARGELGLPE